MCHTAEKLNEFNNSLKKKSELYVWEWTLRVWNNSGRNIKLKQVDFIDMGPLSGDSRLNIEAHTVFKWCQKFWGKS